MKTFGIENTGSFDILQLEPSSVVNISSSYAITSSYALNSDGGGASFTQFTIPTMSYNDTASLTGLTLTDDKFAISVVETIHEEGIDDNTILLLSFDKKTGFITDRTGKHTITTGSAGPTYYDSIYKFGDGCAFVNNSNNAYITVPYTSSEFDISESAFTIDFWINPIAINRYHSVFSQGININDRNYLIIGTTNYITMLNNNNGGTAFNTVSSIPIPNWNTNNWYHIAVVKKPFDNPNEVMFFANGEMIGLATSSADWRNIAADVKIFITSTGGGATTNTYAYIDEIRYSNIARWTSSFYPLNRQYQIPSTKRIYSQIDNINYSAEVSESEGTLKIRKLSGGNSTNIKFNILQ